MPATVASKVGAGRKALSLLVNVKFIMNSIRVVQLWHPESGRKVARVDEPKLRLLRGPASLYEFGIEALAQKCSLAEMISSAAGGDDLDYDAVYEGASEWRLLPAFDHPLDAARCFVAGTGLTHDNSARSRHQMHCSTGAVPVAATDSSIMFQWGREGGKSESGKVGVRPEWFYKGDGSSLRANGEAIEVQGYSLNCGEEAEIVGLYLIGADGKPYRIGFAAGNEFSEHELEEKNYLYLAQSKLQQASIGPEAVIGEFPEVIEGTVGIYRGGEKLWESEIASGERNMTHSIENLEYHHFKYPQNRRPYDAHVYFLGADSFSFGAGIRLCDRDVMRIEWRGMGRALRNPLRCLGKGQDESVIVTPL